jgi:hypothetical protein
MGSILRADTGGQRYFDTKVIVMVEKLRVIKKSGITFIPPLGIAAWDGNQITAEQVKVCFRDAIKDAIEARKMPLPPQAECTSVAAEINQLISCCAHKAHKWDIARAIEPMAKRAWRKSGHTGRIGRTDKFTVNKVRA